MTRRARGEEGGAGVGVGGGVAATPGVRETSGDVNSEIGAVNTLVLLVFRISGEIIPITVTVCPGRRSPATPLARSTWIARAT